MSAVTFDTLKFVQTLRDKANLPKDQAEGIAQAFVDATAEQIASKMDLKETGLRLEAKIEASKDEILKWLFGTFGFQTFIILAAIVMLLKFVKP